MSTLKRPRAETSLSANEARPSKSAKSSNSAEVTELKRQMILLHRFAIEQGLETNTWQGFISKAPPEIREQLEASPIAAETVDKSIRAGIHKEFYALEAKIWALDISITSDDVSRAMVDYVPQIQHLSEMLGGLDLAYETILYLGEHSYARVAGTSSGYGSRPSDRPADELLHSLVLRKKETQSDYNPMPAIEKLGEHINYLRERGIETFFNRSYSLLCQWVDGPEATQRAYNSLRTRIVNSHRDALKEIATAGSEFSVSPSHVLASRMEHLIPEVRTIAYMPVGLHLGFDLAIFLGQQYYGSMGSNSYHKGYGRQVHSFDNDVDELLVEIAQKIKKNQPGFAPTVEVDELEKRDRRLRKVGIKTCFPKSIDLMWPWLPGAAAKFHEDIKKRVLKSYEKTEKQLHDPSSQSKRASSDWHSIRSRAFLPEIKRLSELDGGGILAFELLVETGEHSYLRDDKLGPFYGWGVKAPEWWCLRKFDIMADDLLVEIATKVREETPGYRSTEQLAQLKNSHQYLVSYGVHSYFPKAIALIESWPQETVNIIRRYEAPLLFPSEHPAVGQLSLLNQ
ncbi:hypothetical protein PVAG01_10805 [Phlyctema vagabunda]|uniref:Uncharacterized protein n=1 Tax=Phlyctema vagabunda TaxID=108571 RepID=A0ABR4P3B7_9HELO